MRRLTRLSACAAAVSIAVLSLSAMPAAASTLTVSFADSTAVELSSYGGGSVTNKAGQGGTNFLRATAAADLGSLGYNLVSVRQGYIQSTFVKYTGTHHGSITVHVNGTFNRSLNLGIGAYSGIDFSHQIYIQLWDVSYSTEAARWTIANEDVLCGVLLYPVGLGNCNDTQSDDYGSNWTRTVSGPRVIDGHWYRIRVYAVSTITAAGLAVGVQGKTTAKELSGSLSW